MHTGKGIENNIKKWRHDLSKMTEVRYCRKKLGEEEKERMDRSYGLSEKGTTHIINFLKQRITTGGAKIRRYNQRNPVPTEQHVLHPKLKQHLQECVNAGVVPTWMTEGRTVLIMKDKNKGTVEGNYRPNTFLALMWKLLPTTFSEAMYGDLSYQELLPNEDKGCRKNSRGTMTNF